MKYLPRIIAFLGYDPIPPPEGVMDGPAWYKQVHGLTLEQLAAEMGRDPEPLADWLRGRHKPYRHNREEIERFLPEQIYCFSGWIKRRQCKDTIHFTDMIALINAKSRPTERGSTSKVCNMIWPFDSVS